ncbi:MAG TPA: CoB--CoM heterodisulfide reductase iron-sulfur subunit A family protein, partial [Rhodospirillales bacterium]|nr:CoB--CoM heterodisulfide reductase iron-sulfur subunit A family protein [Rhodospirillales bacterium]
MSDVKIGAYICKGCGLGERLDTAALAKIAEREGKAALAKEHDFLCSEQGVAMIREDIEKEGLNRIVIAACSRRAKTEAFGFDGDGVAVSRANLREGVIWARPDTEEARETTQEMAEDYVRMACAEVRHMTPPKPNPEAQTHRRILVVGGGVSGMTAALEAAKAGYEVTLVEKTGALGGMAAKLHRRVPDHAPYADPQETGVEQMIREVEENPKIEVVLNARITRTS